MAASARVAQREAVVAVSIAREMQRTWRVFCERRPCTDGMPAGEVTVSDDFTSRAEAVAFQQRHDRWHRNLADAL